MLFNSWIFPCFLVIVLTTYFILKHRWQNVFLLVASYIFYGWWDVRFTLLLAVSTLTDYTIGILLAQASRDSKRKMLLIFSCAVNLGILGFFKYFNFFSESTTVLLNSVGLEADPLLIRIILPVGISFYTFQTMSYTIDIYRGNMQPVKNLIDFALYVSFFPQLVAGPIERATTLMPQITQPRYVQRDDWIIGGWLILLGFFKKVVIADNLAPVVDLVYSQDISSSNGLQILFATYCFAVQIYCDFSGYTDIARGVSRLLGIKLMRNFNLFRLSPNWSNRWFGLTYLDCKGA